MSRPITFCAAMLMASVIATSAIAQDTKVTITVDRSKPDKVSQTPPFEGQRPSVDVALLLDTSNSMDGLINQAKRQLWTIVQQFAQAKKNGQTPVLRVALYEYGNDALPVTEGYIRQVVPLTDDLDKLSEALFALSTDGGSEYCGQVINVAIKQLDWSKEDNGYKAIFIAGNEPFTQGPVDYRDACKKAIERGIVVNTIHCGDQSSGVNGKWQDGAQLAEGESFNIDQDRAVVQIKCPQDAIIIKLNAELNTTYLWYGAADDRRRYAENQVAQDANAHKAGEAVAANRAVIKSGSAYSNRNRDLVDSWREDADVLKKLKDEELPGELKGMPVDQRVARIKQMAARRADVQRQITELAAQRESYLAKQQAAGPAEATLGGAVVSTIQKQLKKSGFDAAANPE